MLSLDDCRKKLSDFAEIVCAGQSPLYEFICRRMQDDADLLEIIPHSADELLSLQ